MYMKFENLNGFSISTFTFLLFNRKYFTILFVKKNNESIDYEKCFFDYFLYYNCFIVV